MPNEDFSFLILDARSWRDSIDTALWVNYGWGHKEIIHDRTDPMRVLLGEEQFAWLQEIVRTDSSPLIAVTGLNGLHTIWQGSKSFDPETGLNFNQRGRGAGDYAGWVKAGADRLLELFGSRQGIITVYGDVHTASIMKNLEHRVYESSFGAIARNGSRGVKKGFGRMMNDYDLRPIKMHALYHAKYASPDLDPNKGPKHWNFLEMHMDPRGEDPPFSLKIRNLIDPPTQTPRGGGHVNDRASNTGRPHTCTLPQIKTIPNANIQFTTLQGRPIRATRSTPDGYIPIKGLTEINGKDIIPGTKIIMTAITSQKTESKIIKTQPTNQKNLKNHRTTINQLKNQAKTQLSTWISEHQTKTNKTSGR